MPNTVQVVASLFSIFQSGLVVSGNTRINLSQQVTSGQAIQSIRVSGADEYIQLYLSDRSSVSPVTGTVYVGQVSDIVTEDIYVRRWAGDVSGANNQAFTNARQRMIDSIITVASGVFTSGFNLPRPYLVGQRTPMPNELVATARLQWKYRYLL